MSKPITGKGCKIAIMDDYIKDEKKIIDFKEKYGDIKYEDLKFMIDGTNKFSKEVSKIFGRENPK